MLSSYVLEAKQSKNGNCYYCLQQGMGFVRAFYAVGNRWVCDAHHLDPNWTNRSL